MIVIHRAIRASPVGHDQSFRLRSKYDYAVSIIAHMLNLAPSASDKPVQVRRDFQEAGGIMPSLLAVSD